MIEVKKVLTKKQKKHFINIVDSIYRGNPYFVPTIKADDWKMFDEEKNLNLKTCKWLPLIAYKNGKPAGRVIGLIQNLYTDKANEKRARFMYFDMIEDIEVARALLGEVEHWAKENGCVAVCGPLGFNDLSKSGVLIEGFDSIATSATLYNHPYYSEFLEELGYEKDADWIQCIVTMPEKDDEYYNRVKKISKKALEKHKIKFVEFKNKKDLLRNYGDKIIELVNICYDHLYGTVTISPELGKVIIKEYSLIIDESLVRLLSDENDRIIGFALAFPNISKALNKSRGRMFPFGIIRIMRALKKYEIVDLMLVGILPEYRAKGVNAIIMTDMIDMFIEKGIKKFETNLMLENNFNIQSQIRNTEKIQHKKNRSYIKRI